MLVKFLRKDSPAVLLVLLVATVGIWFRNLFGIAAPIHIPELTYGTPVELFINRINIDFPHLSIWGGFAIMVLVMVQMQSLNNQYIFIPKRSVLPQILFVVVGFSFLSVQNLTPALVALPIIGLAFSSIFASYRKDYAQGDTFLAAFFMSLAAVIYLPAITFVLTLFFALIIMRPFSWREWIAMLAGFIVPLAFLGAYILFFDSELLNELSSFDSAKFIPAIPTSITSFFGYSFIAINLLAFASSALFLIGWTATQKVRTNKIYLIFFFLIANTFLSYLVIPVVSKDIIVIAALPASYIISVYLLFVRRTFIADAIVTLILMLSILLQLFPE